MSELWRMKSGAERREFVFLAEPRKAEEDEWITQPETGNAQEGGRRKVQGREILREQHIFTDASSIVYDKKWFCKAVLTTLQVDNYTVLCYTYSCYPFLRDR